MKKMSVSETKARFLAVANRISQTGETVIVTKRGRPLIKLVPVKAEKPRPFGGRLVGVVEVVGDLLEPAVSPEDWELD
jgi:prevent-host-death family protein